MSSELKEAQNSEDNNRSAASTATNEAYYMAEEEEETSEYIYEEGIPDTFIDCKGLTEKEFKVEYAKQCEFYEKQFDYDQLKEQFFDLIEKIKKTYRAGKETQDLENKADDCFHKILETPYFKDIIAKYPLNWDLFYFQCFIQSLLYKSQSIGLYNKLIKLSDPHYQNFKIAYRRKKKIYIHRE